jgi:hypothetical protein
MAVATAVCPHCSAKLQIAAEARQKKLACPKCRGAFVPAACDVACPKCKVALPPSSVFCVRCGYDFRSKRTLTSAFVSQKEPAKRDRSNDEPERFPAERFLDEPSWKEIVSTPFNMELVISESVILTMWGLFWDFLLVTVTVGYFMALGAMGFGTVFSACMLFAALLRLWMIASDISLWTIVKLAGGLIVASWLIGWLAEQAIPNLDGGLVGFIAFLALVQLGVALRCISFFMGRYFALCRRAALRKTMSGADRGGLYDLGHGLALCNMAFFPFGVVWGANISLAAKGEDFPGGNTVFYTLAALALFWAYFYLPMGAAVVALRGSLNPAVVAQWIGKTFLEYCTLLICFLPFVAFVWGVKAVIVWAIDHMMNMNALAALVFQLCYWIVLSVLLDHYAAAAVIAALGLMMRRNEAILKWGKTARNLEKERD